MEIINKYSISSPNLSNQIPSFSSLDKYIPFVALLKRIALPVSRTCFNYWNISVSFSNILNKNNIDDDEFFTVLKFLNNDT